MCMSRCIISRCGDTTKDIVSCPRGNCQPIDRCYSTSPYFCLQPTCLWPWNSALEDAGREAARQTAFYRSVRREDARGARELQIQGQMKYRPHVSARVTEYRGRLVEEDVEQDERAPRSPGRHDRRPQETVRIADHRGVRIEVVPNDRELDIPRRRDRRRNAREQQEYEREQEEREDEARIRDFDAAALQRFNEQGILAMMQPWVSEQADLDSRGRQNLLVGASTEPNPPTTADQEPTPETASQQDLQLQESRRRRWWRG